MQVFPGSDAALAEAVFAQKDQPGSPMHKVAEKGGYDGWVGGWVGETAMLLPASLTA